MTYDVHLADTFQKSIKALKKKYPHVKDDLLSQIETLEKDPSAGDPIPGWNQEVWKVRVASSDVKKGKRGGYRLIYFWEAGPLTCQGLSRFSPALIHRLSSWQNHHFLSLSASRHTW